MTPNGMASAIISSVSGSTDAYDANSKFYKALCDYVEGNAQVFYSWSAVNPSGSPDPQVIIEAKIKCRQNSKMIASKIGFGNLSKNAQQFIFR